MKKLFILAVSLFMMMPEGNAPLIKSLQQGGYILYVRHGEANVGSDQEEIVLSNCSTQRNLSEEGKKQALSYGEALRRLGIPIQYPVAASPFCRTRTTAELAFGQENVQVDPFWVNIYNLNKKTPASNQGSVLTKLTSILEKLPPRGKNRLIIGHSFPKGVALGEIPDMGTVVVKPRGRGKGYEIVGTISLADLVSKRLNRNPLILIGCYTHYTLEKLVEISGIGISDFRPYLMNLQVRGVFEQLLGLSDTDFNDVIGKR